MYEANEMPVEKEETIAVKSFQYSKTIRGLVVERQGAGGNKTVQIVNLGRHGLFQADLARSEYIMAGALWVRTTRAGRCHRFDGHLRKGTNNLKGDLVKCSDSDAPPSLVTN